MLSCEALVTQKMANFAGFSVAFYLTELNKNSFQGYPLMLIYYDYLDYDSPTVLFNTSKFPFMT